MKDLYRIEFARSIDEKGNRVSPKNFKFHACENDFIYCDYDRCNQIRMDIQSRLNHHIARVHKMNFFENIISRISVSNRIM